ncbi:MAG: phosphoheptose isomerase [Gammaproteobacteria bacterium]|nr:phosphoheptose isomerase [Gammaproteobacteria bacterium]
MDNTHRVVEIFNESIETISHAMDTISAEISDAAAAMTEALLQDRKILACGNGGSAADAQHFASEMLNRFELERPGLPGLALTTDTSTLTSIANDYDFRDVFSKQILALGQPEDILLVITTSGNSPNLIRAVEAAKERHMRCIALNGRDGGRLTDSLGDNDVNILITGPSTARIQEVHSIIIHCFCDLVDRQLLGQL